MVHVYIVPVLQRTLKNCYKVGVIWDQVKALSKRLFISKSLVIVDINLQLDISKQTLGILN